MKKPLFSFLFLYLVLNNFFFKANAQQEIDSTRYYYYLILNPEIKSDIPKAIKFYEGLKEKHLLEKNDYRAINDLRMIAIAQLEIGDTYESEKTIVEALKLVDNSSKRDTIFNANVGIYNLLGRVYSLTNRHEDAIDANTNALRYAKEQQARFPVINNLGNAYRDLKRYDEALAQYNIGLAEDGIEQHPRSYARLLNNKAKVQATLGIPGALENMLKAKNLRERESDLRGKYSSYRSLFEYHKEKNDTPKATEFANLAYETAKTVNSLNFLEDALSLFVEMSPDPKMLEFKKVTDSITAEKQLVENKNAFMKYNVEKERKNTLEAELAKEEQKTWKVIILALAVISFVLGVIFYFMTKSKHKQENIEQVYITEKRISKKVHDEVANDVYKLMAKLQSKPAEKDEILDDLDLIYLKSRDISKENSSIDVEDFQEVLSDLLLGYENQHVSVIRRDITTIDWNAITDIKKTNLYRVLQELMTNMAKHSEASAVALNIDQNGKKITIKYADNGKGCKIKSKNGLRNAESRIDAINGRITFDSEPNKGFKATIII